MPSIKPVFAKIARARGAVASIYSEFADLPAAVEAHFELNRAVVLSDDMPLSRVEREWLALETSRANGCSYSVAHHRRAMENHFGAGIDRNTLRSPRFKLLASLARTLAKEPRRAHRLRPRLLAAGFTTQEWLHAVNVCAYFNFSNRLAFALDLKLEPDFARSCR